MASAHTPPRRGLLSLAAATAVAGAFAFNAPNASAQSVEGFNAQNFKVPTDPHGFITMNGARTLRSLQFFGGVGANWATDPTKLRINNARSELLEDLTQLDLVAGIGLLEIGDAGGLSIGVHAPINLDLHGRRIDDFDRRIPSGKFGDIQANVKLVVFDREEDLIGLYARMTADFPSGDEENLTSNRDRYTLGWQVGIEKQFGKILRVGVEAGYDWIDGDIRIGGVKIDDKLRLNAAIALSPGGLLDIEALEDLWVVVEAHSWGRIGHLYERERESPIELGGAIKYTGFIYVMVGASGGLNNGVGAPEARMFGMVGFAFGGGS